MATLLEMAAEIVSAHASTSSLSSEELQRELQQVYATLKGLESGQTAEQIAEEGKAPTLTVKQAFKKNEVICMVCGKGGFKTLARHLMKAHGLKPGQYRKQFGIPSKQALAAKNFSDERRKMAEERGLVDILAKARETRAAKIKAQKEPAKTAAPKKTVKAATPAKSAKPAAKTAKAAKSVKSAKPAKAEETTA